MAAPVLLGIMLKEAALPPLQSLLDGPSTVFCVADDNSFERKLDLTSRFVFQSSNNEHASKSSPVME